MNKLIPLLLASVFALVTAQGYASEVTCPSNLQGVVISDNAAAWQNVLSFWEVAFNLQGFDGSIEGLQAPNAAAAIKMAHQLMGNPPISHVQSMILTDADTQERTLSCYYYLQAENQPYLDIQLWHKL